MGVVALGSYWQRGSCLAPGVVILGVVVLGLVALGVVDLWGNCPKG